MDRGDREGGFPPTYTCPHTALPHLHPKSGTSYLHYQLSNTTVATLPFRVLLNAHHLQYFRGDWRRWPQRAWFSQSSNVDMYVASYLEA